MVLKISIVIPCKELDNYTGECIKHCLNLDYPDFEILLLPDSPIREGLERIRIIPTGPVKPAMKRNIGVSRARGKICAFIDSDAYPGRLWLKNAVKYLENEKTGIVGGPNLLPKEDNVYQKASDDILSSPMGAGSFALRYRVGMSKSVKELPSVNLFVRKSLFRKIGGFDTSLLTAEDAKLCFQICQMGRDVVYAPDVLVYHHRRPLFRPHLRQMWVYGRDKARLVKGFLSKDRLLYFLPSLFLIYLILGFSLLLNPWARYPLLEAVFLYSIVLYLLVTAAASIYKSPNRSPLVFPGMVLTHIAYGAGFLYGLLRR